MTTAEFMVLAVTAVTLRDYSPIAETIGLIQG
jgi:hypothetical protein